MSKQTRANFNKSLKISIDKEPKKNKISQVRSITSTPVILSTPVKRKLLRDGSSPIPSEQKVLSNAESNTSKEIVQDKTHSRIASRFNNATKNNVIRLRKLVASPKAAGLKQSATTFSLDHLELQSPSLGTHQSQTEHNEIGKNESEQFRSLSRIPSYLVPTYSALQFKKAKSEARIEKGFVFGRARGKKADFLDWTSTLEQQDESSPNNKHQPEDALQSDSIKLDSTRPDADKVFSEDTPISVKNRFVTTQIDQIQTPAEIQTQTKTDALARIDIELAAEELFKEVVSQPTKSYDLPINLSKKPTWTKQFSETEPKKEGKSPKEKFDSIPNPYLRSLSGRFKPAEEFLKLTEHEKKLLEESFRLNTNARISPTRPPQYKKRQTNDQDVTKVIQERLQNAEKTLVEKDLFAGIRKFWNSGLNKELSPEQRQNLMLKPDDVDFFKVNVGNKIQELIETDNEILNRNMSAQLAYDPAEKQKHKGRAMLAQFNWDNHVIQPNFMKESGSMCFTEFWSHKQRSNYFSAVKKDIKSVKVSGVNEHQWESVYRPEKIKTHQIIKNKINQQTSRMGNGYESVGKPEYKRYSILKTVKPLANAEWFFSSQKKNVVNESNSQENRPDLLSILNETSSVLNFESPKLNKEVLNASNKLPTSLEQFSPIFAEGFSSPLLRNPRIKTTRGLKQRAVVTLEPERIEADQTNPHESVKLPEKQIPVSLANIARMRSASKLSVKRTPVRSRAATTRRELSRASPLRSEAKQVKHPDISSSELLQKPLIKNERDDPAARTNGFSGGGLKEDYETARAFYSQVYKTFISQTKERISL